MAPLAHTLALLAMAVATAAIKVVPLDMALDSFDDQYLGCGPAMTAELPALKRSEFQQNPLLAEAWVNATAMWQSWGPPESPLSPAQAIAVIAYVMDGRLQSAFNNAVRVAGRSRQEYRDNFHYKTLHFLLTDALATVRDTQKWTCHKLFQWDCGVQFEAKRGDTVRFGQFMPILLSGQTVTCPVKTEFQVHTCYDSFSRKLGGLSVVLIPPFETFQVTEVTREGDKTQIKLLFNESFSKYNCEWLRGGSISMAHFHLGGLLLATTALAVTTRVL